jgi:predicted transglutaminase-like cysteine proteinase
MKTSWLVRLPTALALLSLTFLVSEALPGAMPRGAAVAAPPGFISFCLRQSTQCADEKPGAAPVHLDAGKRALIATVNSQVNRTTTWVHDSVRSEAKEHFDLVRNGKGDCEDMALTKRKMLNATGIPFHNLVLAIGRNGRGELHAVLVVRTDAGDLVLDSPDTAIRDWREAGLTWIKRQDGTALGWETIPAKV